MSTIEEIQGLVNDARGRISRGDLVGVKTVTWPEIRSAINEYQGLSRAGRIELASLIHGRLDVLGLQAGKKPVDIDVKLLAHLVQERLAGPDSQKKTVPPWLPW